jgi:outer membrane biosynthesis protein TonB
MYLAGILALWALLHPPVLGGADSVRSPMAIAIGHSIRQFLFAQEPEKPAPPAQPAQTQEQPAQQQEQPKASPPENPQERAQPQVNPAPQQETSPPATGAPEKSPNPPQKPNPAGKKKRTKKRAVPPVSGEEQKKKVISHGGTNEPITVLAPGMTDEQAARQRTVTDQLLASTDASLQRLSTRSLNKDQQDTVAQIRKFMQQVKTAQAAGDLQRAYKLAVKAHLLADALEKS